MRRTEVQSPAFVQPKGLQVSNKDAVMEKVNDVVVEKVNEVISEKAVELVEQKTEEIEKTVEDTTDKVLDTVQENTQKVADKIEEIAKPVTDLIDKLDDNPVVKKVLDTVTESVAEQLDGREFSCGCFGWLFALRITRKTRQSAPSTPAALDSKLPELPPQHEEVKESPPPKAPAEAQSETPSKDAYVSV